MGFFKDLLIRAKVKDITDSVYSRDIDLDDENTTIGTAIFIDENLCINCGKCENICPVDAVKHNENNYYIDNKQCIECLACVTGCPMEAIITN